MYNNILHKPLVLKPNVSNSGRDLLEGLLQKDRTKRLGSKDDFVSGKTHQCYSHMVYFPQICDSYSNFCLFVAGDEVPQLLLSHQLG